MKCKEVERWIGPLLDGELDARNSTEVQAHLATCSSCQRRYEMQQTLSSNLRRMDLAYAAPESLRLRIAAALEEPRPEPERSDRTTKRTSRSPTPWWLWAGWPVALAASALLATVLLQQRSYDENEIVAAHVRSLLVNHLSDVVSTDHHTVKPWFAGKLDFSPPVPDLSSRGFELLGGRLDYLRRQPVAAIIYRKHGHMINVLVSLSGRDLGSLPRTARTQGYSLRAWRQGELDMVAISDIDPLELANLEQGFQSTVKPSGEPADRK
jgi:mycothiol system anti-sigma-R factor